MSRTSSIDGGTGDDTISVGANMSGGSIFGGEGNDRIILNGNISGPAILDGGENDDLLFGDILSLGRAQAVGAGLGGITAANAVNFESLHLELTGGGADTLSVDALLDNLASKGFTNDKAFEKIIVTGDAALDMVNLAGLSSSSRGAENVNVDGFSQSFTEYHVTHNDQTITLLLQSDLV
jgi:hypothetical protein